MLDIRRDAPRETHRASAFWAAVVLASRRDVGDDQRQAPLSLAGRRSGGRRPGERCDEDAGQEGGIEIIEENNEARWSAAYLRNGKAPLLRRCAEGSRRRRPAGNWPVTQPSVREFGPSFPAPRTVYAALPANAQFTDFRCRPCIGLQPFQFGAKPLLPGQFQEEPRRRSRRVAPARRGIRGSGTARPETGSHLSDIPSGPVRSARRSAIVSCRATAPLGEIELLGVRRSSVPDA